MKLVRLLTVLVLLLGLRPAAAAAPVTYFVNCGDSLVSAQQLPLAPGDSLLLRRGCTWTVSGGQRFTIAWRGTADAPITIGAYGAGAPPRVIADAKGTSTYEAAVLVTGSYLVISDLAVSAVNPWHDTTCLYADGTPARMGWLAGVTVQGHHITLSRLELAHLAIGVFLQDSSHDVALTDSSFHDLDTFTRIYHVGLALGAMGVLLHGDDNTAARNNFAFSRAATECTDQAGVVHNYSAPFELYNANRARVTGNTSSGARKTLESGKDAAATSSGNVFAYNLVDQPQPQGRGPNLHGTDVFGPILLSVVDHNTIVLTGAGSQALICSCDGGAVVTDNIFIAEAKAAFYGGAFSESGNVYWDYQASSDPSADPFVQFIRGGLSASSRLLDPLLDGAYRQTRLSPLAGAGALAFLPATPTATATASPSATATASATPTGTNSPTPSATATWTPSSTATPTASDTPTPTLEHCSGWRAGTPEAIACP